MILVTFFVIAFILIIEGNLKFVILVLEFIMIKMIFHYLKVLIALILIKFKILSFRVNLIDCYFVILIFQFKL